MSSSLISRVLYRLPPRWGSPGLTVEAGREDTAVGIEGHDDRPGGPPRPAPLAREARRRGRAERAVRPQDRPDRLPPLRAPSPARGVRVLDLPTARADGRAPCPHGRRHESVLGAGTPPDRAPGAAAAGAREPPRRTRGAGAVHEGAPVHAAVLRESRRPGLLGSRHPDPIARRSRSDRSDAAGRRIRTGVPRPDQPAVESI